MLHDDTVANDSILSHLDSAEKNRILYAAFDDTAISYERIGDMRFFHVLGRRFILDFGIDTMVLVFQEQFMPDAAVAQVHVDLEVGMNRINPFCISLIIIAENPQAVYIPLEYIRNKVVISLGIGPAYAMLEYVAIDEDSPLV